VAHTCNPSYSGGRNQEDRCLKPGQANSWRDPISKKPFTKRAGRVTQGEGPEFKPQYRKTNKQTNKNDRPDRWLSFLPLRGDFQYLYGLHLKLGFSRLSPSLDQTQVSHWSVSCAFSPSVSAQGRVSLYKPCGGGNHPFLMLAWESAGYPQLNPESSSSLSRMSLSTTVFWCRPLNAIAHLLDWVGIADCETCLFLEAFLFIPVPTGPDPPFGV
jgi:hypothetical protein